MVHRGPRAAVDVWCRICARSVNPMQNVGTDRRNQCWRHTLRTTLTRKDHTRVERVRYLGGMTKLTSLRAVLAASIAVAVLSGAARAQSAADSAGIRAAA